MFILFLGIIFPSAYNTCRHFDFLHSVDTKSYVKMAQGDYNVMVTHKYRFIIPSLSLLTTKIIQNLSPNGLNRADINLWQIQLSFLIWNTVFLAMASLVLFKWLALFNLSFLSYLIGVLMFATSRWVNYSAGLPMIDSLYYFVVFLFLYGIQSNQLYMIIIALIIGPIAKESFLILIPLLIFSKHWKILILSTIASLAIFYSVRIFVDYLYPLSPTDGLENALNHAQTIFFSIKRICSYKGILELVLVFGWFNIILLTFMLFKFKSSIQILKSIPLISYLFCSMVLAHMLLSGDTDRMFTLSAPFFTLILAKICFSYESTYMQKS